MRDSDCGDRVRRSSILSVRVSFSAGVLISNAVSHRSRISSTIRARGRRTAKERPLPWPKLDVDGALDRGGVAGEEPGVELGSDGDGDGPIASPLYSGRGGGG